jgi:hypothetical protein
VVFRTRQFIYHANIVNKSNWHQETILSLFYVSVHEDFNSYWLCLDVWLGHLHCACNSHKIEVWSLKCLTEKQVGKLIFLPKIGVISWAGRKSINYQYSGKNQIICNTMLEVKSMSSSALRPRGIQHSKFVLYIAKKCIKLNEQLQGRKPPKFSYVFERKPGRNWTRCKEICVHIGWLQ